MLTYNTNSNTGPVCGGRAQPKTGVIKVRFLLENEITNLLTVIEKANHTNFKQLVIAYLNTGARRIELLTPQFTWKNIEFEKRQILIHGKGDKSRIIPMNNTLYNIFKTIKNSGAEFPFNYSPDYISHKIQDYYKKAGIIGANLHSLRKTFGSILIQKGLADLFIVSKLLGHSSIRTTEKYYVDLLDDNYRTSVYGLDSIIN